MSVRGQIKLIADFNSDEQSEMLKSAAVAGKMDLVYGMEHQKRLGFIAPFEHQEYMVGIDRKVQVHLQLRSEIEYDRKKQEVRVKIQPSEDENEYKILEYKTIPFTSKRDILSLQPAPKENNTYTIHKNRALQSQMELNDRNSQQIAKFSWERQSSHSGGESETHEKKQLTAMDAWRQLAKSVSSLYYVNEYETEYQKYSIKLYSSKDMSAEMKVSHESSTTESKNSTDSENSSLNATAPYLEKESSVHERKQKLIKEASENISSPRADALDISLRLIGPTESSLVITAAVGQSNVDQKSRALLFASSKTTNGQDYYLSATLESKTPNVESLDYEETLKANTRREFEADMYYGKGNNENSGNSQNRIKIQGNLEQTDDRKNEIRQSADAEACTKEARQNGNKLTSACRRANQRAASVNVGEMSVSFEKESSLQQTLMSALDSVQLLSENQIEIQKSLQDSEEKNKIKISLEMSPNDEKIDITVKTPESKLQFKNINLNRNNNENNGNAEDNKKNNWKDFEPSISQNSK